MWVLANDDGIYAPGLLALREACHGLAETVLVAPEGNRSGFSNALSLDKGLRVDEIGDGRHVVNGTPADCVHLALYGYFEELPQRVLSGINAGANLGDDALYSGTLAAAMEARHLENTPLSFSVVNWRPRYWPDATRVVRRILQQVDSLPMPRGTVLNINIPDLPEQDIRGFQVTRLGRRAPSQPMTRLEDPRGRTSYWIGTFGAPEDAAPGTDFAAIAAGYVSITPVHADLTNNSALSALTDWAQQL